MIGRITILNRNRPYITQNSEVSLSKISTNLMSCGKIANFKYIICRGQGNSIAQFEIGWPRGTFVVAMIVIPRSATPL